jgi:hypothetical protein
LNSLIPLCTKQKIKKLKIIIIPFSMKTWIRNILWSLASLLTLMNQKYVKNLSKIFSVSRGHITKWNFSCKKGKAFFNSALHQLTPLKQGISEISNHANISFQRHSSILQSTQRKWNQRLNMSSQWKARWYLT